MRILKRYKQWLEIQTWLDLNPAAGNEGSPEALRQILQWQTKFTTLGPSAFHPTFPQEQLPDRLGADGT
jgi:hypothetical protein